MQAVILAGGKGTRLKPLTNTIPKPLLPIGKKPILEVAIEQLRDANCHEVILTVEYKAELIKSYFRNGNHLGISIKYHQEKGPSGTAGPLKLVEHMLSDAPFITMNGDLLTNIDLTDLYQVHLDSSAELTMATATHTITSPYGVVDLEGNGTIKSIREKPELDFLINAGIYAVSPSVLDIVPKGEFFDMPDLIQELINQKRKVETYYIDGDWHDLGTMEAYQRMNRIKSNNKKMS